MEVVVTPATARLFRIRKTVIKMLRNRKYTVDAAQDYATIDDFAKRFQAGETIDRRGLTLTALIADPQPHSPIIVFFPEGDLGVKEAKAVLAQMMQGTTRGEAGEEADAAVPTGSVFRRGIIVFSGRFSNLAKTLLHDMQPAYVIEHFREEELLVDITEHELVPRHDVLVDDEKATLLARYKLRDSQLPRIQAGDPVARYYGMQRGQVVKITRASETAGRYVTYRVVV